VFLVASNYLITQFEKRMLMIEQRQYRAPHMRMMLANSGFRADRDNGACVARFPLTKNRDDHLSLPIK
jgi:hypothetical protein